MLGRLLAARSRWPGIAVVALFATVAGIGITTLTPLGGLVSASVDSESRRIPAPDVPLNPTQAEVLADGVVTRAEYDSAVDRTLACVEAAGGTVTDRRYEDFRDRPMWNFNITYNQPLSRGELSPYDLCWIAHSRDVQALWIGQHEPSAATAARNEANALACAQEEGLAVDTLEAMKRLDPSSLGDRHLGWIRCMTIAHNGYDPHEHAPIQAD